MFTCAGRKPSGPTGSGKINFCLVRHGCTAWNLENRIQGRRDLPLTEEGRKQAAAAACLLKNGRWEVIVASDLARARETAEIISRQLRLPVLLFAGLRERSLGPLEGLTVEEIEQAFPGWYPQKDLDLPGVESRPALEQRAKEAFNTLAGLFSGRRVVVVAHGAFFRAFFTACLGWDRPAPGNGEMVEVTWEDGAWRKGGQGGETSNEL